MKKILLVLIFVLLCQIPFCQNSNNEDIKLHPKYNEIKTKIKNGAMRLYNAELVEPVVTSKQVTVSKDGNTETVNAKQNAWKEDNINFVVDAFDEYLQKYQPNLNSKKADVVLSHLENFTSFKASVHSTWKPSPELGKVIALSVARGLQWALKDEVPYPSEADRQIAKYQVEDLFTWFENYLSTIATGDEDKELIKKEKEINVNFIESEIDSPFSVYGKKELSNEIMESIQKEIVTTFKEKFFDEKGNLKFKNDRAFYPAKIHTVRYKILLNEMYSLPIQSLAYEYNKDLNRQPSKEENEEFEKLFTSLRENMNKN